MREFDRCMRFVEWTSAEPWRMLPFENPQYWVKITNEGDDKWFGKRFTTYELFKAFTELEKETI